MDEQPPRSLLASSFILDQNALLTYRVFPSSLSTSRPKSLFTPELSVGLCTWAEDGPQLELRISRIESDREYWWQLVVGWDVSLRFSSWATWVVSPGEPSVLDACRASGSICPLSSSTMPSSLRNRFISSTSRSLVCLGGAFGSFGRGRRGARPGAGKMQEMCALRQLLQGMRLSHRTLRRRQVTHLRHRGLVARGLWWCGGQAALRSRIQRPRGLDTGVDDGRTRGRHGREAGGRSHGVRGHAGVSRGRVRWGMGVVSLLVRGGCAEVHPQRGVVAVRQGRHSGI